MVLNEVLYGLVLAGSFLGVTATTAGPRKLSDTCITLYLGLLAQLHWHRLLVLKGVGDAGTTKNMQAMMPKNGMAMWWQCSASSSTMHCVLWSP